MSDLTDPAKIAGSLTERQRDCLLFWGKGYFPNATVRSLYQRRLIFPSGTRTPLGQAVAAYLKEMKDG